MESNLQKLRARIPIERAKAAGLDTSRLEKTLEIAAVAGVQFEQSQRNLEMAVRRWSERTPAFRAEVLAAHKGGVTNFCGVPIETLEAIRETEARVTRVDNLFQHQMELIRMAGDKQEMKFEFPNRPIGIEPLFNIQSLRRYKPKPAAEMPCPECAHTETPGKYVGLSKIEDCLKCGGKTTIPADEKPAVASTVTHTHPAGRPMPAGEFPKFIVPKEVGGHPIAFGNPCAEIPLAEDRTHRAGKSLSQDNVNYIMEQMRNRPRCTREQLMGTHQRRESLVDGNESMHVIFLRDGQINEFKHHTGAGQTVIYVKKEDGRLYLDFENTGL